MPPVGRGTRIEMSEMGKQRAGLQREKSCPRSNIKVDKGEKKWTPLLQTATVRKWDDVVYICSGIKVFKRGRGEKQAGRCEGRESADGRDPGAGEG